MRFKSVILCVLFGMACYCVYADGERKLQQISPHVWAYAGTVPMSIAKSYGANAGVVVGEKGALVVDTLISAKEGQQLLDDIHAVTKQPLLWVVNTHYHLDHAWGNGVFATEGARVIGASRSTELLIERGTEGLAHPEKHGLTKEALEGTTLSPATVSFTGTVTIDLGGIVVELRSMPHGHCEDNLVVWVPKEKILFSGDLLFVGCHPFMGEGNIPNWLADLDALSKMGAEKIIPGHGRIAHAKDITDMKEYLRVFDVNAVKLAKGKSQADAPKLAEKLAKQLPDQGRTELTGMLEYNLRAKYLPQEKTVTP